MKILVLRDRFGIVAPYCHSLIIGSRPNIQKIEKQTEAKPSFEIVDLQI